MKRIWLKFQRDIRLQSWRKCVEASHQRWCSFSPSSGQTTKHIVTKRPPGDSWDADESIDMQIKCTERIAKEKLIFFSVSGRSTGGRWNGCPIWRNSLPAENNRDTDRHNGSASGVIKSQANDWRHSGFERKSAKSGPAQDKRRDAEEDSGGLDLRKKTKKKNLGPFSSFPPLAPPRRPWSSGWKICLALWEPRLSVSEHVLAGWRGLFQLAISRSFTVEFRVFLYRSIALELLYFESFECNWIWFNVEVKIGP